MRLRKVAYRPKLPLQLTRVHDVFHVSMLRKCDNTTQLIIDWNSLDLQPDVTYEEQPIQILDRKIQKLRNREIPMVKVRWEFQESTKGPEKLY